MGTFSRQVCIISRSAGQGPAHRGPAGLVLAPGPAQSKGHMSSVHLTVDNLTLKQARHLLSEIFTPKVSTLFLSLLSACFDQISRLHS